MSHQLIASFRARLSGRDARNPIRIGVAGAAAAVAALGVAGIGTVGAVAASAATPTVASPLASHGHINPHGIVPGYGAYLGADPDPNPGQATASQAAALEHLTHHALGLVSFFVKFEGQPIIAQLDQVAQQGSIPFVSMKCGPTDASVAAGQYDKYLINDAKQYKQFGGPVLLRWFWEMNLPIVNQHQQCLGVNEPIAQQGQQYIAAYQHIWKIFHQYGATNVYFVWCPSAAQHAAHETDKLFYPGSQYVDWIGGDLYDRPLIYAKTFQQQIQPFYDYWTKTGAPGKPLIIGETGAVGTTQQVTWLKQIMTSAPALPSIKAYVYVDANDQGNYILTSGPHGGLAQFIADAQDPFFADFAPHVGYVYATSGGGVYAYLTPNLGGEAGQKLPAPIAGIAYDRAGTGYWLVGADGSVYAFGTAHNFGSLRGVPLKKPIVGIAALPNGTGYWLVASDGGIFAFGNAHFFGSMGGKHLNKPIVGMTSDPVGTGYWFVASDGGIFTFGSARFFGSTGYFRLNKPIDGMSATPDAKGYWLVAEDGGMFAFGDATFKGSLGGSKAKVHIVGMSTDQLTGGYRMVTMKGTVFQFPGAIAFKGPALQTPVVAMDSTQIQ